MKTLEINCNNNTFILHPFGVVYWLEEDMLLLADVHLGKVTHFRKHGSAIPQASMYKNFDQLSTVISFFKPNTICFLGDLFHSRINNEWLLFKKWTKTLKCKMVLISGNHDIIAKAMYDEISVCVKEEWIVNGFLLTHYPEIRDHLFNFSGHIHPGVSLQGFGKQFLKVSCFLKRESQLILPAFGVFTGKYIIEPRSRDKIYVNSTDEVIEVKTKPDGINLK